MFHNDLVAQFVKCIENDESLKMSKEQVDSVLNAVQL